MYTRGSWRVSIAVPTETLERLRGSAADWLHPSNYGFVTEVYPDGSDGPTTLDFDVEASEEDVRELATEAWRDLLGVARIEPFEPDIISLSGPWGGWEDPRHEQLRADADTLMAEGRFDLAVVRAQSACEVLARSAIAGAFRGAVGRDRGDALAKIANPALSDGATQKIIGTLTGSNPTEQRWWKDYKIHLTRRNQVAHGGRELTHLDAEASLEVVDLCMNWLGDIWSGRVARTDPMTP